MVEPLNKIGIDVACLGNHELDYELEDLIKNNTMRVRQFLASRAGLGP